jgi:ferric-dicitrate binding protein FerR (iron transport regulator)
VDSERGAGSRDRAVAQIAQQITLAAEQRRRSGRFRLRALVLCAAAAVFAIGLGASGLFWRDPATGNAPELSARAGELRGSEKVTVERSGVRRPAQEAMALAPGDEVHTPSDAHTTVLLSDGAAVDVKPESRLLLGRNGGGDTLELLAGELSVSVPKLGEARTFSVRTPDARVVVHGTRFVVSVLDAKANPRTRVRVLEGRVGVEYRGVAAELLPGEGWPRAPEAMQEPGVTAPEPQEKAAASSPAKPASPPGSRPSPSAVSRKPEAPVSAAALAEQNRMFAAAVAASRRGDDSRAIALIDELLARHPTSPLLPEARVERFRALKRLGQNSEAAREASRYLLENENGAARDEAREVVLPDPK